MTLRAIAYSKVEHSRHHTHFISLTGAQKYQLWGEENILWFNMPAVLDVLSGDTRRVSDMFVWVCTPKEVSSSWPGLHYSNTGLSNEQRTFLEYLVSSKPVDEGEDE